MKKIIIVGVGGFGREVAWLIERINQIKPTWELLGFVDDNIELIGSVVGGYPVLGDCNWLNRQQGELYAVCAIGASKVRKQVIKKLKGVKFATLIDPKVEMSKRVNLGEGCIICAGTILTVDITIGSHVIINLDCTIGHDAVMNDFVTLYPSVNISGNTVLGECVEMGTGCQIIQGITIGDETIVGAGAVVVRELPRACTAVGSPAKPIKFSANQ
ncbi:MAG TPA: acetyltransferase [Epulopiscium sp.]|nr:acetyltransferase [Candidatus Epulonipiscium sp.]